MFMSQDEIYSLTGYKVPARQIQWLRENGIKHLVGCDGKARILISHINEVMGSSAPTHKKTQPNFECLR